MVVVVAVVMVVVVMVAVVMVVVMNDESHCWHHCLQNRFDYEYHTLYHYYS